MPIQQKLTPPGVIFVTDFSLSSLEPHIITRKTDLVIEEGGNAKFKCIVSKKYTKSWKWMRGAQILKSDNRIRLRDHVFLKIKGVTKNDSGMYFCHVTNRFGIQEMQYTLTVTGKVY